MSINNKQPRNPRVNPREKASILSGLRWQFVHDIRTANIAVDSLLPSVNELTKTYGVSLAIARDLYKQLKSEGLVESEKGVGVFLRKPLDSKATRPAEKTGFNLGIIAYIQHDHPMHALTRAYHAIQGVEHQNAQVGGTTKLYNLHPHREVSLDLMEAIKNDQPDGLIFMPTTLHPYEDDFRKINMLDIPCLTLYNVTQTHSTFFDENRLAVETTTHLVRRGYPHIAFIQRRHDTYWAIERLDAYKKVVLDNLGEIDDDLILLTDHQPGTEEFLHEAETLMERLSKYDRAAVFCSGDGYAAEILSLAKAREWNVPERLGIAGNGDEQSTRHLNLTTTQMSGHVLGSSAFELLTDIIRHTPNRIITRRIPCPLIIRHTT